MVGTDVEKFLEALESDFKAAIRALALAPTPAGLNGWTPEQVEEQFDKSVKAALVVAGSTP